MVLPAIAWHHLQAGIAKEALPHKHADVQRVLSGIRKTVGMRQRRVAPVVIDVLRAMVGDLPATVAGAQALPDRAWHGGRFPPL